MSHAHDQIPLPKPILVGAGLMLALTFLAAGWTKSSGIGATRVPDSPAVAVRHLRFADADDGSLVVRDAANDGIIDTIAPGEGNFVRGTMRGLARERKRSGIGEAPPFVLSSRADGRLTLEDPATGRHVDLEVFGPANAGIFARYVALARPAR
jgi:putative photosynthetic complex assembly protein